MSARAASPSLPPHLFRFGRLFTKSVRFIRKGLSAFNSGIVFHHNSALVVLHFISSNSNQSPSLLVNCAVISLWPMMTDLLVLRALGFHAGCCQWYTSLSINVPSQGIHSASSAGGLDFVGMLLLPPMRVDSLKRENSLH